MYSYVHYEVKRVNRQELIFVFSLHHTKRIRALAVGEKQQELSYLHFLLVALTENGRFPNFIEHKPNSNFQPRIELV